jgi:simple sugar transport system substrate-binding protein
MKANPRNYTVYPRSAWLMISALVIIAMLAGACTPAAQPVPATPPTAAPALAPTTAPAAAPTATAAPAASGTTTTTFKIADRILQKMKAGQPLVIRVSYHDVSNEFAPQIKAGVEKAAGDLGNKVDVKMVGPTGAKADDQIAELENLMTSGVDGLAISSVSTDALAPIINKALEQGIPVVTFNTDNPSSKRLAFVGQDLMGSGRIAGDLIAKQMNEKGNILITTLDASAQWSLDREKGAREALGKYPNIKILSTINTGTEPQAIYSAIENAMLANPTTNGILSMECCSNPAAGEYVKRSNLKDKVTVVGFDLLPQTLQLVKDGYIKATIGQAPQTQGEMAVKLLVDIINGKPAKSVDTGAEVVDASNIDKYMPK